MREDERCRHPDCVYRAKNVSDKNMNSGGNCNFLVMTGRCRIAGLPDRLQLPCNCIEYIPDGSDPAAYRKAAWKDKALALYNTGATDREIEAVTGVSRDRIGAWRRRNGLPVHADRKGHDSGFDWERAEELYRHGLNDKEIAEKLGCSVASVWRWRYKYELFPNDRGGRKRGAKKK